MKYKAVIFDLDGVICHTDKYHYLAWKKLADEKIGVYFDEQINDRLRGVSRMESLEIILEKSDKPFTQEEKEQFAAEKNTAYTQFLAEMSPSDVSADVARTLDALRNNGIKMAIGSSSRNARIILKQIGLLDAFDVIVDGNMIKNSKPDPEVFLLAAELLGLEPRECLVVEDAAAGIESAVNGGFDVAGIGFAKTHADATHPIDSVEDILKLN